MVASDTMVGIVGAVVLTVALVGIFAYESSTSIPTVGLKAESYEYTITGTSTFTPQQEPPDCVEPAIPCAAASFALDVTVKGLPGLGTSKVTYMAFLEETSGTRVLGELTQTGSDHTVRWTHNADHASGTVVFSLEASTSAAQPGLRLGTGTLASKAVSGSGTIQLGGEAAVTASVGATGVGVSATGLPVRANMNYGVWIMDEHPDGTKWVAAGVIEAPEGATDALTKTFSATVEAAQDAGYDRIVLTLETSLGSSPGMPVFGADLK